MNKVEVAEPVAAVGLLRHVRGHLESCGAQLRSSGLWCYCDFPPSDHRQRQGWKIHVSAYDGSAEEILQRSVTVLAEQRIAFKFASDLDRLSSLAKSGDGVQRGKFLTAYPRDENELRSLSEALVTALRGLPGPPVETDLQVTADAPVFYRYGAFSGPFTISPIGRVTTSLLAPDGRVLSELRTKSYQQPDWVRDPLGGSTPKSEAFSLAARFVTVFQLYASSRGCVWSGADLQSGQPVILKRAATIQPDGRLARETAVLQQLGGCSVPSVIHYDYDPQTCFETLVLEDDNGTTAETLVVQDGAMAVQEAIGLACQLAEALAQVHARGFVHRDIKPSNIVVSGDRVMLLDFDIAAAVGTAASDMHGRGTAGFASPQQWAWQAADPSDDVYSFGAVLFAWLTGSNAMPAARFGVRAEELLRRVQYRVPDELVELVLACLAQERHERPALEEIQGLLVQMTTTASPAPAVSSKKGDSFRNVCEGLLATAVSKCGERDAAPNLWDHGETGRAKPCRSLATGDAGTAWTLWRLASEFDLDCDAVLDRALGALAEPSPFGGDPHPGLYVGEAGRLQVLAELAAERDKSALLANASAEGLRLAKQAHFSPDLYHGSAGRARFHLAMASLTGDEAHRVAAIEAGEYLLATQNREDSALAGSWSMPTDLEGFAGSTMYGYAHGAAGIADVLLDLSDTTGDSRFFDAAREALEWVIDGAVWREGEVDWPNEVGGQPTGRFWCRGAVGVGHLLLSVAGRNLGSLSDRVEAALVAIIAQAGETIFPNATLCHGLSGSLDFLVSAQRRGHSVKASIDRLAAIIDCYASDGLFYGDNAELTFNYTNGTCGIVLSLAASRSEGFGSAHFGPSRLHYSV